MRNKILIVEDEPQIASVIQEYLEQSSMDAEILTSGERAVETILTMKPDLVVLDIMLPGKSGIDICREVRQSSNVPIIFETARVEEIDRLLGLELGADDYICKPFSPRELVARVKTVLRRIERSSNDGTSDEQSGKLQIDEEKWIAEVNGTRLDLTRREFQLLCALRKRPGRVFSRMQLLDVAFPEDSDVYDRTIDSHIKNLRKKLKEADPEWEPVRSVYGVGYAYDG